MFHQLFQTGGDWTGLILRLTAGLILLPHGLQKAFGWLGGYGFQGTMNFFTETVKIPWLLGFLVIVVELAGSLSIIAGLGVRFWAAAAILLMAGIVYTSHIPNGFFMNWSGAQAGEGYEYHLLFIGICIVLLLNGAGKWSLDGLIGK